MLSFLNINFKKYIYWGFGYSLKESNVGKTSWSRYTLKIYLVNIPNNRNNFLTHVKLESKNVFKLNNSRIYSISKLFQYFQNISYSTFESDTIDMIPHCNDFGVKNSSHYVIVMIGDVPKQDNVACKLHNIHEDSKSSDKSHDLLVPNGSKLK